MRTILKNRMRQKKMNFVWDKNTYSFAAVVYFLLQKKWESKLIQQVCASTFWMYWEWNFQDFSFLPRFRGWSAAQCLKINEKKSPLNFHFKSNFENTYLIFSPFFKLTLFRCNALETKMRPFRLFQNTVLCCESWLRLQCCPDALAPDACKGPF